MYIIFIEKQFYFEIYLEYTNFGYVLLRTNSIEFIDINIIKYKHYMYNVLLVLEIVPS